MKRQCSPKPDEGKRSRVRSSEPSLTHPRASRMRRVVGWETTFPKVVLIGGSQTTCLTYQDASIETYDGGVLLFEEVQVDDKFRSDGVDKLLIEAVLTKISSESPAGFIGFARPAAQTRDVKELGSRGSSGSDEKLGEEILRARRRFWGSAGFRRVGNSNWMAFTHSSHHASRRIENNQLVHINQDWKESKIAPPPHPVDDVFREFRNRDFFVDPDKEDLEEFIERFSGQVERDFSGFDELAVTCIAALENKGETFNLGMLTSKAIEIAASATDGEIKKVPWIDIAVVRMTLRYKYGCSCGQCLGGFMSPANDVCAISAKSKFWTNEVSRKGFTEMWRSFVKCLRERVLPTKRVFTRGSKSGLLLESSEFLEYGGTIDSVVNRIFELAMKEDDVGGNGQHRLKLGQEIDKLPACRDDHEFGFILTRSFYL
ncbi:hypothetical protein B0T24DRAFT_695639 [Lasiosphaeria ovina]|uniref:Uncharacterized protein n=1 Tax=Lasiosphaeria ovina TaxID=92902 RepID=A0AAE0NDZ6_9PEZI|nr:hypothetical protein B0T24DRAFT_695639 [Lasiosphaeria ovina]